MSGKHKAGKGSKYRTVDQKKWDKNWEKAFIKKETKSERNKNSKINNR